MGLCYEVMLNPDLFVKNFVDIYTLAAYGSVAVFLCFFPLAGCLADTCGHYKVVFWSIILVVPSVSLPIFACIGLVGFTATVLQFGVDQLRNFQEEKKTVFIHWVHFVTMLIAQTFWNLTIQLPYNNDANILTIIGICLFASISLLIMMLLPITLCLARCRREWFVIDEGVGNPCKLIYGVTKYRETPAQYYEEVRPARLATSEQVEDVKVFYGILKVLFSFGMVFFLDFAATSVILCSTHNNS